MELLFLLFMMTRWIQQSDSANCTLDTYQYQNESGREIIELSFQCPFSDMCRANLLVNTTESTADCLRDIELVNTSCSSANNSLTTTNVINSLCKTQTVEYTKTIAINHTIQHTIQHTQTLYNPTTLIICPTTSSSLTSTPTESPTTVAVTTCQEPTTVLSGIQQISVLATLGAVICLLTLALMTVTSCWVWTRRALKKRARTKVVYPADDSINTDDTEILREYDNPLYEEQKLATKQKTKPKPLQHPSDGPAYAIPLNSKKRGRKEPKKIPNGASRMKSSRGVAVGVASRNESLAEVDIERNYHLLGKEIERRDTVTKKKEREHQYDKPTIATKPKKLQSKKDERVNSERKEQHLCHSLEGPIPRDENKNPNAREGELGKETEKRDTATKKKPCEHQYDKPIVAVKPKKHQSKSKKDEQVVNSEREQHPYHSLEGPIPRDENKNPNTREGELGKESERRDTATTKKVCEHQYDKPTIAVKPKKLQSKKDERVDSERKEQHPYHVLEGSDKNKNLNTQEGELGKEIERRDTATKKNKCEHQYDKPIVAIKPKKLQSKKDERVDSERKEQHTYHVLEEPIPSDENKINQEGENEYYVLEGPTPVEEKT